MPCTARKNLRERGEHRRRSPGPGRGQPAEPARRPREPVRRAGPLRPARDGRPRPSRSRGASSGRAVRGRRSAPAGVAGGGGPRRPGPPPPPAAGNPHPPRTPPPPWGKDTRPGLWRPRREVAYYVSQVGLTAEAFGRAVRAHWGIENRSHHVRDRIPGEDASRIRRKPGVFARLRSFALNILRARGVTNVSEAVYTNALSLDRLLVYGQPMSYRPYEVVTDVGSQ